MGELITDRLRLRQWRDDDLAPFRRLNGDAEVMRYFPAPLSAEQSDALATRLRGAIDAQGWGLWVAERLGDGTFLGFVGLARPGFEAPFMPAVEIGWRLDRPFWGQGYATEAARACLDHAFGTLGLDEVVSFTAAINDRSRRVMERLHMTHDPADDFEHPRVAAGPLRTHVLYRIRGADRPG